MQNWRIINLRKDLLGKNKFSVQTWTAISQDKYRQTKITHNGFDYTFAYDGFGNRKSVSIAGKAAVSHDYKAKNGNLFKSTYANGWEVTYTYDNLDRVTEVKASKDGTSYTIGGMSMTNWEGWPVLWTDRYPENPALTAMT